MSEKPLCDYTSPDAEECLQRATWVLLRVNRQYTPQNLACNGHLHKMLPATGVTEVARISDEH